MRNIRNLLEHAEEDYCKPVIVGNLWSNNCIKYENNSDKIIRGIRNLFEHEEEHYYKPVRICNFWSNSCIEYENNGDRNKALSVEEYLNKIRPYIKNNLKNSGTWKVQLTIMINLISS